MVAVVLQMVSCSVPIFLSTPTAVSQPHQPPWSLVHSPAFPPPALPSLLMAPGEGDLGSLKAPCAPGLHCVGSDKPEEPAETLSGWVGLPAIPPRVPQEGRCYCCVHFIDGKVGTHGPTSPAWMPGDPALGNLGENGTPHLQLSLWTSPPEGKAERPAWTKSPREPGGDELPHRH